MLLTRGEAVQRNTSAEGVPVIRKQIQDLKDSWDSLLSASIQCKRLLSLTNQSVRRLINGTGHCLVFLDGFVLVKRVQGRLDLRIIALVCYVCSLCVYIVMFMLQPAGRRFVTVDQLSGGCGSVCGVDGPCRGDTQLLRQTILWDERQDG